MRGVTAIEAGFRRSRIPVWARPALGGVVVGLLGCITPKAMSSGHSALHADINVSFPFLVVLGLDADEGGGLGVFHRRRGFAAGCFSPRCFWARCSARCLPGCWRCCRFCTPMPAGFYAVVGMSALAVAIVGGPMTMTFLALESTQNFAVTMAVLAASIVAAITVRRLFGYSFATWRFHLRGEADPQRGRYRLDPFADGGADDARGRGGRCGRG